MTKDEALDLALEALTPFSTPNWAGTGVDKANEAIAAIKQYRSAPVQPVRGWWAHTSPITGITDVQDWQLTKDDKARGWIEREIYTTSPAAQRQWVGLTDEEIQTEWLLTPQHNKAEGVWFGRRLEAKLKEKNGWYRQHVTDGSPCWCEPEISYTDPETGASVIVHKEPQ
jgi:hypothetical protein